MSGELRPRVVHVSGDFPDPLNGEKTPVIRSLIDLTAQAFDHRVFSINRRSPGLADAFRGWGSGMGEQAFSHGTALAYLAPPAGLLHAAMLTRLGDWLAEQLQDRPPDLLVGHKLTIEGLVVARAAQRLHRPYALTLQGNTDTKILAARPDLRRRFAAMFQQAAAVFAFAPWTLRRVEELLGARNGPSISLPCPTDLDQPMAPQAGGEGLVTLFHLRHRANKNLAGMAAAHARLPADCRHQSLTVLGGGTAAQLAACRKLAGRNAQVHFAPGSDRKQVPARLNRAKAFILPSLRESFGLVYIEALFAGVPIIHSRGRAVDGHFDGAPFALAVDPRDSRDIARAMERAIREEDRLKDALHAWQSSDHARRFTRPAISSTFAAGLRECLAGTAPSGHNKP